MGWLGEAKVSCSLRHRGAQLILAYSWARPTVLAARKDRGGMFFFLLFRHFLSLSLSSIPLFNLLYYLFYLFSPFLWETTQTHQGASDEYPQQMFLWRNKKNIFLILPLIWSYDIDTILPHRILEYAGNYIRNQIVRSL